MKKIIVPVDFSPCSHNALNYAVELAQILDTKLEIIYVHKPDLLLANQAIPSVPMQLPISEKARESMNELKQELSKKPKLSFVCKIEEGFLDDTLMQSAKEKDNVMIVMGTQGAYNPIVQFLGTNTSRLVELKKVPILAIPENYKGSLQTNASFLFATDFKDINNWEIMDGFKKLATKINAKVNVFYVKEPYTDQESKDFEKEKLEEFKKYFKGLAVEIHHSFKTDVVAAVETFAKAHNVSLVMMIAHDRSWISDLFHKSVTVKMVLHTHVPFLSIPDSHVDVNLAGVW